MTIDELAAQLTHVHNDLVARDASLRQEVGSVRQEVGSLRQEVGTVRQQVGSLRQEVGTVRQEVGSLRQEVQEDFADVYRRVDHLQATLNEHGQRLSNIEQAIVKIIPALRVGAA